MAFKVQRVSKVKPPPNLPGPSSNNTKQRLNSDKDNPPRLKSSGKKPKVPGRFS
ncbi:Hypothetical predicted protein [Paramuricea clavata]|uniref:Uncharacterized protein n=1 Tax=Paramuricea clavata TaxID=317549 RepID=A0A7D9INH6_PARCT|nr:Hypothetical predicted protein [Paramuricea clavata]